MHLSKAGVTLSRVNYMSTIPSLISLLWSVALVDIMAFKLNATALDVTQTQNLSLFFALNKTVRAFTKCTLQLQGLRLVHLMDDFLLVAFFCKWVLHFLLSLIVLITQ